LVYGARAPTIPPATGPNEDGQYYVRFLTTFTTVDPYSGSVTGCLVVEARSEIEGGYSYGSGCVQPWIEKGLVYKYGDTAVDLSCDGFAQISFSAKYQQITGQPGKVQATGTTFVTFATCAGGLTFTSNTLTHLTLFGDGKSALWTGYGQYNVAPYVGNLNFTAYAVDGGNGILGDYIWLRIFDSNGNVYFDTDPCMPTVTNITIQPKTPNSLITADTQQGVTISNPAQSTVSAIGGDGTVYTGVSAGVIAGIVIAVMAFIVIVATITYFLLAQKYAKAAGTQQQFVAM